jgi:hypothetical protein
MFTPSKIVPFNSLFSGTPPFGMVHPLPRSVPVVGSQELADAAIGCRFGIEGLLLSD